MLERMRNWRRSFKKTENRKQKEIDFQKQGRFGRRKKINEMLNADQEKLKRKGRACRPKQMRCHIKERINDKENTKAISNYIKKLFQQIRKSYKEN